MPEFLSLPRELIRSYFKYVFAFILTALSVELGNILDGVMVGQIIGPDAVAAVGTTLSLLQGYYSVYVLLGGGGGMRLLRARRIEISQNGRWIPMADAYFACPALPLRAFPTLVPAVLLHQSGAGLK